MINIAIYIWHSVDAGRRARLDALNASVSGEATWVGKPLILTSELSEEERIAFVKRSRDEASAAAEVQAKEPSPTPAPAATPQPQPAPEATGGDGTAIAEAPAERKSIVDLVIVPNQCLMVGPVNQTQFNQIAQRLLALTIITETREVQVPGATEYWVVLPPLDDEKAAVQKLQEMQGRGLKAQILPKGELANAIAFGDGVFTQRAEADVLAEKLRGKGVKVEIKAIPRVRIEKWLSLSERQAPKLDDALWEELKQDFPSLRKQIYRCH